MSARGVQGLQSAHRCERPGFIPTERLYGTKALGLRYERVCWLEIEKLYGDHAAHGAWFEYFHDKGRSWCQVDILFYEWRHGCYFLLECKLTDTSEAAYKLEHLYIPVAKKVFPGLVFGIVCARHLTQVSNTQHVCTNLQDAMAFASGGNRIPVLHYIGRGPI